MKKILAVLLLSLVVGCGSDAQKALEENTAAQNANTEAIKAKNNQSGDYNEKTLPEDAPPAKIKETPKNDLSAALSGNRLHLAINGEEFFAYSFHPELSGSKLLERQVAAAAAAAAGEDVSSKDLYGMEVWSVSGNRVTLTRHDLTDSDTYLDFADLTASKGSKVIVGGGFGGLPGATLTILRVEPIRPASDTPDSTPPEDE